LAAYRLLAGRLFCSHSATITSRQTHLINNGFLWDIMGNHGGQWELTVKYGKMV